MAVYAFRQQDFNDDSLIQFAKETKRAKRPSQNLGVADLRLSFDSKEFKFPENAMAKRK